jgi:hypothetical protein
VRESRYHCGGGKPDTHSKELSQRDNNEHSASFSRFQAIDLNLTIHWSASRVSPETHFGLFHCFVDFKNLIEGHALDDPLNITPVAGSPDGPIAR